MIAYKVVTESRESAIINDCPYLTLTYLKGSIVKAKKGTAGIMVFRTRTEATNFERACMMKSGIVIKVRTIGSRRRNVSRLIGSITFGNIPKWGALKNNRELKKLIKNYPAILNFPILCYPAVEVLE